MHVIGWILLGCTYTYDPFHTTYSAPRWVKSAYLLAKGETVGHDRTKVISLDPNGTPALGPQESLEADLPRQLNISGCMGGISIDCIQIHTLQDGRDTLEIRPEVD